MSLVFSAVIPHAPIIVPSVGKDNVQKVQRTTESLKEIEYALYASKPDVLLIISPHGIVADDHFTIAFADRYLGTLNEFGDLTTRIERPAEKEMTSRIVERCKDTGIPVHLVSTQTIDYGTTVPLLFLTKNLPTHTLIPISYSLLPRDRHIAFGKSIRHEVLVSTKRVAVIASGDLAHSTDTTPADGEKPPGRKFDEAVRDALENDPKRLTTIDKELTEQAKQCVFRSLLILLGILDTQRYRFRVLSYESPFGVGYLSALANLD